MAAKTAPGLDLQYGWELGESGPGVKNGLDMNVLKTSILLNLSVISRTTALPASPSNGARYIVPTSDATNGNKIAARVDGAWLYITPKRNWIARVEDAGDAEVVFDGTAWVAVATSAPVEGGATAGIAGVSLGAIATSPGASNADFDFLSMTIPAAELTAGMTLEALFQGTQSQAAASQNLIFYAKINEGAAITIGQVGTGASAQSNRAISGTAMLGLMAVGPSGQYTLGGSLMVNGIVPYSSNSASGRAVNTTTQLKLTIGIRCSVADAANINTITAATIKRVG